MLLLKFEQDAIYQFKKAVMDLNRFLEPAFEGLSKKQIQHQLSELLGIAPMTVYNKISGRSEFSVREFLTIASHYQLSVDKFLAYERNQNNRITFEVKGMANHVKGLQNFLENVFELACRVKGKEDGLATHICTQPHIFLLAEFPALIYFKMYLYNMLKWKKDELSDYDPTFIQRDNRINKLLKNIVTAYQSIETIEVLNSNYLSSICAQIDYLYSSKVINQRQVKNILYELRQMVNLLVQRIESGKFELSKPTPVRHYINNFTNLSNMVLVEFNQPAFFAVQLDAPDVISSSDPFFLRHIKGWMTRTMDFSHSITGSGGLLRTGFINTLYGQVERLEENLLR